ncbi:Sn1-specific diacylglycerol lipase beta [Ceratocystis lukuohia]|uniref:sn-1-specific diacylglycerol lipase n=1 Tax=Ceratocystis lukuohia TaxID=2019550 RepID=A0ABR4MF22_9PEZI
MSSAMQKNQANAASLLPVPHGPTLLPGPLAFAVTAMTQTTGTLIRASSKVTTWSMDVARTTTVSSLGVGMSILETAMYLAGRDVQQIAGLPLAVGHVEPVVEASLDALYRGMTCLVFLVAASFRLSSTMVETTSHSTLVFLTVLNQFFGSTDSSRAMASIIALIRREFRNPATGIQGETVGVKDLLISMAAFAYLQNACLRLTEEGDHVNEIDEMIWDVVVLDDGVRIDIHDIHDISLYGSHKGKYENRTRQARNIGTSPGASSSFLSAVDHIPMTTQSHVEDAEAALHKQITAQLPANAKVLVSTNTVTTKTITVDIPTSTTPNFQLTPPPGAVIVRQQSMSGPGSHMHRIVYRIQRSEASSAATEKIMDDALDNAVATDFGSMENEFEPSFLPQAPSAMHTSPPLVRPMMEVLSRPSTAADSVSTFVPSPPQTTADLNVISPDIFSPSATPTKNLPLGFSPVASSPSTSSTMGSTTNLPGFLGAESPFSGSHPTAPDVLEPDPKSPSKMSANPPRQKPFLRSSRYSVDSLRDRSKQETKRRDPETFTRPTTSSSNKQKSPSAWKFPEKRNSFKNALKLGSASSISSLWNRDSSDHYTKIGHKKASKSSALQKDQYLANLPSGGDNNKNPSTMRGDKAIERDVVVSTSKCPASTTAPQGSPCSPTDEAGNRKYPSVPDGPPPPMPRDNNNNNGKGCGKANAAALTIRPRQDVARISSRSRNYSTMRSLSPSPSPSPSLSPSPMTPRAHQKSRSLGSRHGLSMGGNISSIHRHPQVFNSDIYSLETTNDSESSLVFSSLSSYHQRSAYNTEALKSLRRTGMIETTFPRFHILRNITRYILFSSASYGSHFLRYLGLSPEERPRFEPAAHKTHRDVRAFAQHTNIPPESVILASFVDAEGGSNSEGNVGTGSSVPLVHYIALDHESKAVVLACRGTLGFEDVLTDLTCEYDEMQWRSQKFQVHKGIHASARRLLYGEDGKVLATLKATLDEFPDYGLVLTGHSLGGAVTALLGVMLAEPNPDPRTLGFVTASKTKTRDEHAHLRPPSGRSIHVYAYGAPSTMCRRMQKATRGLITSVVHGNDVVPYLSLGVLHDFQALSAAFKSEGSSARAALNKYVTEQLQNEFLRRWYGSSAEGLSGTQDTLVTNGDRPQWAISLLQTLRGSMKSEKLLPPGEVFQVECTSVLRRNYVGQRSTVQGFLGSPAKRIVLRYVRDVPARFKEIRFRPSMLMDHSPSRYEESLNRLRVGVEQVWM